MKSANKSRWALHTKNPLRAAVIITVALCCIGCSTSPKQKGPNNSDTYWMYSPDSLSIHPLSRFTQPKGKTGWRVVVHVEFKDGDDFACRGTGALDVSIYAKNGRLLATKPISLANAEGNYKLFDPVTRTYQIVFDGIPEESELVNVQATYTEPGSKLMRSNKHTVKNYK
jgi:hypothetical protein